MRRLVGALILVTVGACAPPPATPGTATATQAPPPSPSAVATRMAAASLPAPSPEVPQPAVSNGSGVTTLALDESGRQLWFVTDDVAGQPVLRRFDVTSRTTHDVRLPPDASYIREFGPLKIDPAGVVWLAGGRRLVRYDPATARLTSLVLPSRVAGALPGASSGPNQGVWPSALAFLDGRLLVARNNVPWLTVYNASFREVGRIAIPYGYAGARDLAVDAQRRIYLLPNLNACYDGGLPIDVLDSSGRAMYAVDAGGDRLLPVGEDVLLSGGRGGGSWISGPDVTTLLPDASPFCGLGDLAVPAPRGGATLFLQGAPGGHSVIERVVDGSVVGAVTLPDVDISSAPRPPGASLPPTAPMRTSALATDASGTVWMNAGMDVASVPLP